MRKRGGCAGVQVVSLFGLEDKLNLWGRSGKVDLSIVSRKIPQRPSGTSQNIQYREDVEESRSYPIVELVDGESNEEDEDGDKGDCHPSVANVDRKVGQLGLKQGLGFCNKGSFFF